MKNGPELSKVGPRNGHVHALDNGSIISVVHKSFYWIGFRLCAKDLCEYFQTWCRP